MNNLQTIKSATDEQRRASDRVITEMRAMGLDETFIAQFLDDGQADDIIRGVVRREGKAKA